MATDENEHTDINESSYLAGSLLLAMPGMTDPRFKKAVILICAHDEHGAMGLIINHILPDVDMAQLFKQLEIPMNDNMESNAKTVPVMSGGPVETARGFVLHSSDFNQQDTIQIRDDIGVTGTIEALREIGNGKTPEKMLFLLGYAGWGAGQLDQELQQNSWLVVNPDADLVFNQNNEEKWDQALSKLGIDPAMLSVAGGSA